MTNVERFAVEYWVVWYEAMSHRSTEIVCSRIIPSVERIVSVFI
jgi:hypothetical protein